jgi:hypothetical protein
MMLTMTMRREPNKMTEKELEQIEARAEAAIMKAETSWTSGESFRSMRDIPALCAALRGAQVRIKELEGERDDG